MLDRRPAGREWRQCTTFPGHLGNVRRAARVGGRESPGALRRPRSAVAAELEVTESVSSPTSRARAVTTARCGVTIALDDFGCGTVE